MAIKLCTVNNSSSSQCLTFTSSGAGSIPTAIDKTMERDFFEIQIPYQFSEIAEDFGSTKTEYKISGVLIDISGGDTAATQKRVISEWLAPSPSGNPEGTASPTGTHDAPLFLFSDVPFNEGGGTTGAQDGVPVQIRRCHFSNSADDGPNQIRFDLDLFRVDY